MNKINSILIPFILLAAVACQNPQPSRQSAYETTGSIERLDPALDAVIDTNAKIEIIAEGFKWTEGPLWVESEQMLLFSDIPANTVYKWTAESGAEIYLKPSGYTGTEPHQSKEPGSNGLLLDNDGNLVLCQHGNRQVARMDAPLKQPASTFITLADRYDGKRFSSPNDAVYNRAGALFFTDPPYGLPTQRDDDPAKETKFNGVYKMKRNGELIVLASDITKPNGIAFFPGERKLLVASSDSNAANWYVLGADDTPASPALFYSATDERDGLKGLPDGLKIDKSGTVFASGPGGIWIFDPEGNVLGKIKLDAAVSNVALSADEQTIYATNHTQVLRIKRGKILGIGQQ